MQITEKQVKSILSEWSGYKIKLGVYSNCGESIREFKFCYKIEGDTLHLLDMQGNTQSKIYLNQLEFIDYDTKFRKIIFNGANTALNQVTIQLQEN